MARERGFLCHTDAAQSAGKIPVRVGELGVDLLALVGDKLYAPKGGSSLCSQRGLPEAPDPRSGHESGRRAGTENILLDGTEPPETLLVLPSP